MAMLTAADLSSVLAELFEETIQWQINRAVVLSQLLDVTPGTGKNIQWVARFGTAAPAGAVIADGADVSVYNSDTKVPAVLQFGTYHDAFSLTGKARAGAMAAGNPQELADLFSEEITESVTRLAMAIAADIYTGTGATDTIHGLLAADGGLAATGTYAGIDRATYSQWASNVLANGGVPRALSLDLMREMRRTIYQSSGERPDLIVCDPIQHENYGKLFGSERRYVDNVRLRGQTIKLDGGYQVLEFDGIPVVEDINCPAGKMVFLSTRYVHLKQLPSAPDNINRSIGTIPLHGTPEEQYGAGRSALSARIQPLAITGDASKFELICYPQVQVKRPQACGVIEDLS